MAISLGWYLFYQNSNKTDTLMQNEITVREIWLPAARDTVSGARAPGSVSNSRRRHAVDFVRVANENQPKMAGF